MASEPIGCDPLAEYREVAERRRRKLPDPRRAVLAHIASSTCIAAVAAALLASSHWR
ncbi:hypothetical protein [Saccharothrix sp. ST-888]|uniref:hypothetical protein n=1 Tax=Saccharothrix sp. ST-888 TaxID=1427391 RepID=UPI000AA5A4D3|nr:hypothetical protein [Saccharothrix sp. ST-888]